MGLVTQFAVATKTGVAYDTWYCYKSVAGTAAVGFSFDCLRQHAVLARTINKSFVAHLQTY